jgi:hypothetical protein
VLNQSKHVTTLDHHQEDLKLVMLPKMLDAHVLQLLLYQRKICHP